MNYKTIVGRFFFIIFLIFSINGTAVAITLTASPNPAAMGKTVTFKIKTSYPGGSSNYFIVFGDGSATLALGNYTGDATITATHTYTQAGVYTANAYADDLSVVKPNPVYLSVRVSDFQIKRLETWFENNRPEITIKQREPVPAIFTKINFSGSGLLKGYWEVDGFKRNSVFRQLSIGPEIVLQYPAALPLPTFTPGSHIVRFVITQPSLDIAFPKLVYYVTGEEYIKISSIGFLMPEDRAILQYQPGVLKWETAPSVKFYLVHIFQDQETAPIYSAYSSQGSYSLRPEILSSLIEPQKSYRIQVKGFNDQTQLVAESKVVAVQFK
ncbi:MAG: hypothetical protein ABIJ59_19450 [Pseudomonadota bacterium]